MNYKKLTIIALTALISTGNSLYSLSFPYAVLAYYFTPQTNVEKTEKTKFLQGIFKPAAQSYQELNTNSNDPFNIGIGISMSQIEHSTNTAHPHFLAEKLQKESQKVANPKQWLKDHWGYVVQSLPDIKCQDPRCHAQTQCKSLYPGKHDEMIMHIIDIITHDTKAQSIHLDQCPLCKSKNIKDIPISLQTFSDTEIQSMIEQIELLGSHRQTKQLPTYRFSIELSKILQNSSDQVDPTKLQKLSNFLRDLQHPLTFMHHYSNPQCKPNLFEDKKDIDWFAQRCADVVRACPGLTHVCPINQIMGFGMQVSRQTLPPFGISISQAEFLQNIIQAQVKATREMKKINPNIKVLISHQWKPMRTKHGILDPRYAIEKLCTTIADYMYNQKFVKLTKPYLNDFDGIALSIYPALYFDMWKAESDNCSGKIDPSTTLEAIEQTAQAFPGKDIYIAETGCNNINPEIKKKFVDMTLQACTLARQKNIPVKTCFFWGHSNKSYMEWNKAPGTTHFGAFKDFKAKSINTYGQYLQSLMPPSQK